MAKHGDKVKKSKKVVRTNDLPTNPTDLKALRASIGEASNALVRSALEKETAKSVVETILNDYPIEKKLINKLVKIEFKQNYSQLTADAEALSEAYEKLHPEYKEDDGSED